VPTKRPSAGEIVELLLKNPRVVSPCIDVPLASVQIERTDSLEMLPKPRKKPEETVKKVAGLKPRPKQLSPEDQGYGSGAYSPMGGLGAGDGGPGPGEPLMMGHEKDEAMGDTGSTATFPGSSQDSSPYILANVGSYVPEGYIVLDHSPYSHSVSSI
jgi:hypothetical protein